MKNRANVIRGRIEEHGEGLGTSDEALVLKRAKEIAVTNGRRAQQVNASDLGQARLELEGAQNAPRTSVEEEEEDFTPREGPMGISSGRAARTKLPTDEQAVPEDLVAEGLEEAN